MNRRLLVQALTWAKGESMKTNSVPGLAVRTLVDEIKRLHKMEAEFEQHRVVLDNLKAQIRKTGGISLEQWHKATAPLKDDETRH